MEVSKAKIILKTAAKTLAVLLVATCAIAVIIAFGFPYEGYKLMYGMGLKKPALYFAERYASAGNIEGLIYCVELDDSLLSSTGETQYANKMITHTENFFNYENVDKYFEQVDRYYYRNSPRISHVGLYSYEEYLVSRNYMARTLVGENDKMLFRGEPTLIDELFASEPTDMEKAFIYSALARALSRSGNNFKPLVAEESLTDFYYGLTDSVTSYIMDLSSIQDTLKVLFLMRSVIYLVDEVKSFFERIELQPPEEWMGFTEFEYHGQPLLKAYSKLYLSYIKVE